MDWFAVAAALAAVFWGVILLLPWQPWRNREVLEPAKKVGMDFQDLTVLIPARDEAGVIGGTLESLAAQAPGIRVVLVDDGSSDGTAETARHVPAIDLTLVDGKPLPGGWSGKLWALEQGLAQVSTDKVLLLDADIELKPGMLTALLSRMNEEGLDFVSLMARLRTEGFWEKLLMPAFVYFFKFLYPFALANDPRWPVAAAAGGCILVRTEALRVCGAFVSLKDALIDDCALATRIKSQGYRTWIGLSQGVISHRAYDDLAAIWEMVARTAFTQLGYSRWLLAICTLVLGLMFWVPPATLAVGRDYLAGGLALTCMGVSYFPILRFYRLPLGWAVGLPLVGLLYMAMTWDSALRYWRGGVCCRWKGRVYAR